VPSPTPDSFAALARSSPWRWSTLRFTVRWPADRFRTDELHAWLRRPDALRVATVDGEFVQVVHEPRTTVAVLSLPPTDETSTTYPWPVEARAPGPVLRPDGLVDVRPPRLSYDAPMYRDYSWVAMLDPVEFADGRDPESGEPESRPLLLDEVTEVQHGGRPAWEAVVRTAPTYEPRCSCCALLRSREIDVRESVAGGVNIVLPEYPDAFRVRLDVGTGVCVLTEAIGGLTPGAGHDLRIEAVDEPMSHDLFSEPRRGFFRRRP
jgi:hypothetical protein